MRYFHIDSTAPLRFSACGNLISDDGFLHQRRCFSTQVIIHVLEGELCISQGGESFEVKANQYIYLPAGEEHIGTKPSQGKLSYLWAHFTVDEGALETQEPMVNSEGYFIPEYGELSHRQHSQRVRVLFNQLLDLSRQEGLYNSHMTDYAVSLLTMAIGQDYVQGLGEVKMQIPPAVLNIMEWIHSNAHRHIAIADIAEHFGYNVAYLSGLFKKCTGYTLNQYLIKARLNLSKQLLSNNGVSVKEAAFSCGFYDEKYYMKLFKKQEGVTPTEYKNTMNNKETAL